MMHTHQFPEAAQLRLLEIVEFPVETTSHFPLVARIFMQCEGVVMEFEARKYENTWVWHIKRFCERLCHHDRKTRT